jgi:hypothetical protein
MSCVLINEGESNSYEITIVILKKMVMFEKASYC